MPFLGGGHGQNDTAISAWERVLRPLDFKRIIELGTFNGNFSVYLALWCQRRRVDFYTYDNQDWRTQEHWSWAADRYHEEFRESYIGNCFKQLDLLTKDATREVGGLIAQDGISVLFCDDGNKTQEFLSLAPYVKVGDLVAAHDWDSEIHPSAIKKAEKENNIKFEMVDIDKNSPQTVFFVRKE